MASLAGSELWPLSSSPPAWYEVRLSTRILPVRNVDHQERHRHRDIAVHRLVVAQVGAATAVVMAGPAAGVIRGVVAAEPVAGAIAEHVADQHRIGPQAASDGNGFGHVGRCCGHGDAGPRTTACRAGIDQGVETRVPERGDQGRSGDGAAGALSTELEHGQPLDPADIRLGRLPDHHHGRLRQPQSIRQAAARATQATPHSLRERVGVRRRCVRLPAVGNAPLVVPPLDGLAADFRLKPVLRTCVISCRVQYRLPAAGTDTSPKRKPQPGPSLALRASVDRLISDRQRHGPKK